MKWTCGLPVIVPVPVSFFSSSKRFSRLDLLLVIFCLTAFCWLARLQGHHITDCCCWTAITAVHSIISWSHDVVLLHTHLSETATASGSVGGIIKQTAGAVSLCPAASFTSHLVPLFRSSVYLSPRKICPCMAKKNDRETLALDTLTLTLQRLGGLILMWICAI